ncbi:MAG: hypothetical protein JWQ81_6049 [Amycolatopsis sp.]|uniref:hypothetical protein n=1 Tax=Amycolatopsis sp. TaxID=37632 RepID=UPI00260DABBF|nr:hypothetical protein [Amycolatopsis sp.]MCU1685310.1 hypothetical protein [Amycolatopsis sp.]
MTADTTVLQLVRQAVEQAHAAGSPAPGRPTLARLTGATEHQVRQALASLATDDTSVTVPDDEPTDDGLERPVDTGALVTVAEPDPPALAPAGETVTSVTPGGGKLVAWAGFLFGSATSIAANVLASRLVPAGAAPGWQPSIYAEVGAAVWPLGLLLSVEALSRVRWPAGALWNLARYGGAGTVALGSAVISYGHIREVLLSWGYTDLGAGVGPLVIDGLMTICGFAMLATSGTSKGGDQR